MSILDHVERNAEFLIHRYITKRYVVRSAHLELTNFCDLPGCVMCPVNRMKREKKPMSFSLVRRIVEENPQIKAYGLNNWGEPMIHHAFWDIAEYLESRNKGIFFATNAVTLDKKECERLLSLRKLLYLNFSIDAVGSDYEKIRGYPYWKIKRNVQRFIYIRNKMGRHDVGVNIVATVFHQNEVSAKRVEEEWRGIKIIFQPALLYRRDTRRGSCCELFSDHVVVLSNGIVVPCCADYEGCLQIGDANTQSLNDIVNSPKARQLRLDNSHALCDYCSEYQSSFAVKRFKTNKIMSLLATYRPLSRG